MRTGSERHPLNRLTGLPFPRLRSWAYDRGMNDNKHFQNNKTSLFAFRIALACSGLFLVLFVSCLCLSGWKVINFAGNQPGISARMVGGLVWPCFFLALLADAVALFSGFRGLSRGETNASFVIWGSIALLLGILPALFVVLIFVGWLRSAMGFN